jgi:hypothetical protein
MSARVERGNRRSDASESHRPADPLNWAFGRSVLIILGVPWRRLHERLHHVERHLPVILQVHEQLGYRSTLRVRLQAPDRIRPGHGLVGVHPKHREPGREREPKDRLAELPTVVGPPDNASGRPARLLASTPPFHRAQDCQQKGHRGGEGEGYEDGHVAIVTTPSDTTLSTKRPPGAQRPAQPWLRLTG